MVDQKVFNAILTLVVSEPAFAVDLFTRLTIHRLEDGTFAVHVHSVPEGKLEREELFITADRADECFLNLREEMQLGLDFEKAPISQI
jgi:hypothetical protein